MVADNKAIVHTVVSDDLKAWLLKRAKAQGRSLSNYTGWLFEQARLMAEVEAVQPEIQTPTSQKVN